MKPKPGQSSLPVGASITKPVVLSILPSKTIEDGEQDVIWVDESDIALLIYALRQYKPTNENEVGRTDLLLEMLEEAILPEDWIPEHWN